MQSYPFTSQVTYDEQDLPIYDRAVDSAFLREVFAQYFSDGVFYKPTSAFQVTVGAGMNVLVNPGACHIRGAVGIEKSQRTLAIQAAETMDRIDTVVLRLDLSLQARSIDLFVVKGTASTAPQAPALTRNSTVWELGLANIFVAKNTTSVTQQRITDTRLDNTRCGVVAQTIGELDTSPYFAQIQAVLNEITGLVHNMETATQQANTAAVSANSAASSANTAAIRAESAAELAENAATGYTFIRDPTTGIYSNIQLVANNIYNAFVAAVLSPITAQNYDSLGLAASDYDAQNITAKDYDTTADSILGG